MPVPTVKIWSMTYFHNDGGLDGRLTAEYAKVRSIYEGTMPWKCPACSTEVVHANAEATPRPGVIYRCPVCRLELAFDPKLQKMRPSPAPSPRTGEPRRTA
jgi:hypothetical protein